MRYSRKMWHKIRAENPERPLWDIGKLVGQLWRELPDSERAVYQQEYESEKGDYEKAMKAYQNSPAYQQFLTTKNRSSKVVHPDRSATILQNAVPMANVPKRGMAGADNAIGMIIQVNREGWNHRIIKKIAKSSLWTTRTRMR